MIRSRAGQSRGIRGHRYGTPNDRVKPKISSVISDVTPNPSQPKRAEPKNRKNRNSLIARENSKLGVANVPMATTAVYSMASPVKSPIDTAKSPNNVAPTSPKEVANALGV